MMQTGAGGSAAHRLERAAHAIEPILNRVVLAGPPAAELLMNDAATQAPRLNFAADSVFQLLSTSMIDRLGLELQRAGFALVGRTAGADRWCHPGDTTLDLIQVQSDGVTPRQLCLEYATLLTHAVEAGGLRVRCASAPAVLALECISFAESGAEPLESEELERVVLLIACRTAIETECAAAPAELRAIITTSLAALAATDALHLLVRRALPDAAALPALAKRVRERVSRMAC